MKASNIFTTPQGEFKLERLPLRQKELLQAWDAADQYILEWFFENRHDVPTEARILLVNDAFGALSVPICQLNQSYAWTDSFLSHLSIRHNLTLNGFQESQVTVLSSMDLLPDRFDLVLLKIPKTLAMLQHQLLTIKPALNPFGKIIAGGMVKYMPASIWPLFETIVGPTESSKAKKKSRLIFATPDWNINLMPNPFPVEYVVEETGYRIINHANVFSKDQLDIGTRFFMQNFPKLSNIHDIIDLGCGNGILGIIAAKEYPNARVHFIDESFMAVASAETNFHKIFGSLKNAKFSANDCLTDFSYKSADLILCNPPFHQNNTIVDGLARKMFKQSAKVLRQTGQLWVVGNRHLNYHSVLRSYFKQVECVASNKKFVILKANA